MKTGFYAWTLLYLLTGSPWLAFLGLGALVWLGEGWWRGRLYKPWSVVQRWLRMRKLRAQAELTPYDMRLRAELGSLLVSFRRAREAVPHLEAAVERSPELAYPWYDLAKARLALGDLDGATQAVEQAMSNRKRLEQGQPWADLGDAWAKRGDHEKALSYYEKAESVHASSVRTLYKLGQARKRLGQAEEAKQAFADAGNIYRTSPPFKRRQQRPWAFRAWWARTF